MNKKISELDEVYLLKDGCCFPLVQDEETKKVSFETMERELAKKFIGKDVTDLENYYNKEISDSRYLQKETEPLFRNSPSAGIKSEDITNWNNKSDFSGDYNDLDNKPTIPTVPTNVSAFENDAGYLTEHQDISGKEDKTNKVTSLDSDSTNTQYPSAKAVYDELNKRLKYKGHVNSKEDLPAAGQASGELIEPNYVMDTSNMDSKVDNPLSISSQYWVATYLRTNVYAYVGTEFDEIIDGVCFGKYSNKGFPFIHVNASSTKPAKVYNCAQIWYDDGTTATSTYTTIINKPAWLTITYNPSGAHVVYGKLNHDLKLKYWSKDTLKIDGYDITNINNQSITINGFIYNLGYKMMHFDNNTERLSWITTTGSDINENDVYTVGDNYDLVRGNATEQKWEPLAPKSDLYKTYTGYDETKTQVLKNINGTLTWVEEIGGE